MMRNRSSTPSTHDQPEPRLVRDARELKDVCRELNTAASFAFDTEFVGEDNYEPEVCLIQAATDAFCAIIDPLADLDLSAFWALVANPDIRIIVHAGAEDLAMCYRYSDKPATNVFDVQIGAGLIGLGYPISLTRLAQSVMGIKLHKSQTLTDWRRRPLTSEQLEYAALDVAHLPSLYRHMQDRLTELERVAWAEEECARACVASNGVARGEQRLRRLRGSKTLSQRELLIAEALIEERDKLAREYNRPPRTVLRDHLLVELARRGWTDPAKIRSLRGLNLNRAALDRLVTVIQRAKTAPLDSLPPAASDEDTAQEEALLALITAVARDYCQRRAISFSLLATKQDLRTLVRKYTRSETPDRPILLLSGWRREAVGELLERVLTGRAPVRVVKDGDGLGLRVGTARSDD